MGNEPDALLDEAIAADNACFAAAQRLRRGARRSTSAAATTAASGTPKAATTRSPSSSSRTLDVDRFLLEYDDERSGTFDPLRFVPKGKTVVLGLISTKRGALENADAIARRIEEAAKFVPLENLALSPQCGFASTMEGNLLTEDEQWAKLKLVIEVAERVWG